MILNNATHKFFRFHQSTLLSRTHLFENDRSTLDFLSPGFLCLIGKQDTQESKKPPPSLCLDYTQDTRNLAKQHSWIESVWEYGKLGT